MPRWLLVISALLLGWGSEAVAQTWPSKPIRAIVAFAAGSATDVIPRVVFEPLSAQLEQPIVVENRGGGGTTIAGGMVAKAEPDGYTTPRSFRDEPSSISVRSAQRCRRSAKASS